MKMQGRDQSEAYLPPICYGLLSPVRYVRDIDLVELLQRLCIIMRGACRAAAIDTRCARAEPVSCFCDGLDAGICRAMPHFAPLRDPPPRCKAQRILLLRLGVLDHREKGEPCLSRNHTHRTPRCFDVAVPRCTYCTQRHRRNKPWSAKQDERSSE